MAEEILSRYSRNGLLVDTNLLVLLVTGLVGPQYIEQTQRTSSFTPDDFELLRVFLELNQGKILTTPHILAETSNLVASEFKLKLREKALGILREFVEHADTVELHLPGKEVVRDPIFLRYGLTDTGIARLKSRNCAILTADGPLFRHLLGSGLHVINFQHQRGQRLIPQHYL